uniref:Myo-inositol-1-phosphate synthase n=1 Tax=Desulfacinum infernum TaxID=35837 RepID=A0A832A1U9_9BACT
MGSQEADKKTGVWLIGARGAIAVTVILGTCAVRRGLMPSTGMVTAQKLFEPLGLVSLDRLAFGGWDVRATPLMECVWELYHETYAFDPELARRLEKDIRRVEPFLRAGTLYNCGQGIEEMAEGGTGRAVALASEVERLRADIRWFKKRIKADRVIVVNVASTEPPIFWEAVHHDPEAFEKAVRQGQLGNRIRASTLYAYAAVLEGCPYINFTPSNGALIPALVKLAQRTGVPVMGNDGKTGETLVKSALAPLFACRNLEVMSWEGFNILGNRDGKVLACDDNKASKKQTKEGLLGEILGYRPHAEVHIHYVPSLHDQKTAWDFIHFKGFLGARMSLQFIWQGFDSFLAAPLVLDLVRLADLAQRRGESGLMPQTASFFKAPLGVPEHRLSEQYAMLERYVDRIVNERMAAQRPTVRR